MSKKLSRAASANYARGILSIDLPNAVEPTLWRQEIKDVSSLSFTLQRLQTDERALVLRADGGAEQIIATFHDQADAHQALEALRPILLTGGKRQSSGVFNILRRVLLWLLLLFMLWFALRVAFEFYATGIAAQTVEQHVAAPNAVAPTEPPQGVPVPADDYLATPE